MSYWGAPPQHSCRLRIVDPRTGEEVQPDSGKSKSHRLRITNPATGKEVLPTADAEAEPKRFPSDSSEEEDPDLLVVRPRRGNCWEWPLSHQERKERFFALSQAGADDGDADDDDDAESGGDSSGSR